MVKTGSASLGTVALGTDKIVVSTMVSITVGKIVSHRVAIVRWVCMAGSAICISIRAASSVAIVAAPGTEIRLRSGLRVAL